VNNTGFVTAIKLLLSNSAIFHQITCMAGQLMSRRSGTGYSLISFEEHLRRLPGYSRRRRFHV